MPARQNSSLIRTKFLNALLPATLCVALALGTGFESTALAAEPKQPVTAFKFAPNLSQFKLDNGLEVVVIPDHRAPVVTHMIWYKAGSADEPEGQSGVAHFLEHLLFKGTKAHPNGEFSKIVAGIGGQENAFTSNDYTAYYQRVAKQHLKLVMSLEADRMENLQLSKDVIGSERDVVLEERRMRVEGEPASRLREDLNATIFVNHPYGDPVIGWNHEIQALNRKAVVAFYDRFYTPNNAVLVIAGDVNADQVKTLAEETYGKVKRRAEPGERQRPEEPSLNAARTVTVTDKRVRQESFSQNWIVPSQTTGKGHVPEALEVLSYILGGGPTSRLYKNAVLGDKIALSAGSYYRGKALNYGRFGIYGTPTDGHSLEDLRARFANILRDLIKNGVTEDELNRAKQSMIAEAVYAQDSQMGLAQIFGSALTTGQTVEEVQTWPQQIEAVTAQDIQKAAKTFLSAPPVTGLLKTKQSADAGQSSATASPANSKS